MTKRIAAGEFKAKCLKLLDEVSEHGAQIVVTKRGVPVARLVPITPLPDIFGHMRGTARILGDIVEPVEVEWESSR